MKSLAAMVFWVLLAQPHAQAQSSASAWDLVHPTGFDWQDKVSRGQLAGDLLKRVEILAAVIPPMTSSALEKLRREQAKVASLGDDASPRRRGRLYLSKRFQHQSLLELVDQTLGALSCAANSRKVASEMACWAQASAFLLEEDRLDLGLNILREARMVPRDEDMHVTAQDPVVWYGEYGRGMVRYILIPYMQSLKQREVQ